MDLESPVSKRAVLLVAFSKEFTTINRTGLSYSGQPQNLTGLRKQFRLGVSHIFNFVFTQTHLQFRDTLCLLGVTAPKDNEDSFYFCNDD